MITKTYIQSSEWEEKRKTKLEDCKSKCECEGGCVRKAILVHHLHHYTLGYESMEDLQALCSNCYMAKTSKFRNFYGNPGRYCCLVGEQQEVIKTLPYDVWKEANFYLLMDTPKYSLIGEKLGTDPIIAALLDNLGIMFANSELVVTNKVTEVIKQFADVVPAKKAGLGGYCDIAYKIKPEFEKYFKISSDANIDENEQGSS